MYGNMFKEMRTYFREYFTEKPFALAAVTSGLILLTVIWAIVLLSGSIFAIFTLFMCTLIVFSVVCMFIQETVTLKKERDRHWRK